MHVLVLVIVSFDKPEYHDMLAVWRERARDDVWFIQCKSDKEWIGDVINDILDPSLKDRFELDVANKTLYVRGDECLIPGILHKTVEALSFFLRERSSLRAPLCLQPDGCMIPPYDYVWRTNLSSVLDFAGLERFLSSLNQPNGLYAGYIGKALFGDHNLKGGGLGSSGKRSGAERSSPTFFASGAGFLMSCDVAMYLVSNRDSLRWDIIDDVAIGALLEPRFGLMHLERCWVQSEHIVAEKDVFHFRCESYQHLRTVEFMRLASKWIASRHLEVDRG